MTRCGMRGAEVTEGPVDAIATRSMAGPWPPEADVLVPRRGGNRVAIDMLVRAPGTRLGGRPDE